MEVFAGFWFSSTQAIQGSIRIWAIVSFTCTLLLPHQKPNVMPAAKQPYVQTQQKHNPVLLPWKWCWDPTVRAGKCPQCAAHAVLREEAAPQTSAQSISLSFPKQH